MIGVVAHERWQVERHREAGLALRQQIAEARISILGGAEAGKLAHGPQSATIHRGVYTARIRGLAGLTQIALGVPIRKIGRGIKLADGVPRYGGKAYRTPRRT